MTNAGVIRTNRTYKVSGNTDQRIRALAKTSGRTMSAVIEDAVLHAHLRRVGRLEATERYKFMQLAPWCWRNGVISNTEFSQLLDLDEAEPGDEALREVRLQLIVKVRAANSQRHIAPAGGR